MKDHDDDDYFNICIVYEGNLELLDTAKALFMRTHIKRRLGEMGLPHYPVRVFAEKSEWEKVNRSIRRPQQSRADGLNPRPRQSYGLAARFVGWQGCFQPGRAKLRNPSRQLRLFRLLEIPA